MRILFLLAVAGCLVFGTATAQSKEDYLQKSRNQRTAGWIMLGGGVVLGAVGAATFNNSDFLNNDSGSNTGGWLFVIGGATALGSIPFFISSAHNARKAATISFKPQRVHLPVNTAWSVKWQPAVSVAIRL